MPIHDPSERRRAAAHALIQVSADVTSTDTRRRELRALERAMGEYDQDQAWLVTLAAEETVALDTGRVHIVPAWRFCLYDELPS